MHNQRIQISIIFTIFTSLIITACSAPGTPASVPSETSLPTSPPPPTQTSIPPDTPTPTSKNTLSPTLPVATSPTTSKESISVEADGSGDFPTLAEAVQNAPEGATLLLGAGVFRLDEALEIDKPLSLVGKGMDQTVIVSDVAEYTAHVKANGAFSVEGITFKHEGDSFADAIDVEEAQVTIKNCRFSGGKMNPEGKLRGAGLRLEEKASGVVQDCVAEENATGIWVDAQEATLEGNTSIKNLAGILFSSSSQALARSNRCQENQYNGFVVSMYANPTLEENTSVMNQQNGFYFLGEATGSAARNECSQNQQNGILVDNKAGPTLEKNVCNENGKFGIAFVANATGTVSGNTVMENQMSGILLSDFSKATLEENTCSKNSRFGIAVGLQAEGIVRKNICEQNLWSGIMVAENASATLEKNVCTGNVQAGIAFRDQSSGSASRNQCVGNEIGLYVQSSANPELLDNDCHGNTKNDILDER